jgi:hypothetical protein
MVSAGSMRHLRAIVGLAIVAAILFALPSITQAPTVRAQEGATGYSTCSNGSIALAGSGCGLAGPTLCNGALSTSGACSGPGLGGAFPPGTSPFGGQTTSPSQTTTCPGGVLVPLGQTCSNNSNIYITCSNGIRVPANVGCPAPVPTQLCPNGATVPSTQACPPGTELPGTVPVTTPGVTVTYASGWNIVAGPGGTMISGNVGPLYAMPPGSTSYQTVPAGTPLQAGAGYLAFFPSGTTATIPQGSASPVTVQLPPGQWVLIGNPGSTSATVSGADTVLVLSPGSTSYSPGSTLAPGQGAWAVSVAGGQATITNAPS